MEKNTDIGSGKYLNFEEMNLKENLLRGIFAYGFEKPSKIQSKAIVPITSGIDIIAQSQSGTGKTGTFVISALQTIDNNVNGVQAIIVSNTRELAFQIKDVCSDIGQYLNIKSVICVGGTSIHQCKDEIDSRNPIIVIGTPGRINDMIGRGYLRTRTIKILVVDEADEMLSECFQNQIRAIIQSIPFSCQICLFSATMPKEIIDLTKKFLKNPKQILVKREELTLKGIKQFYIHAERERWKFDILRDIYGQVSIGQSMLYVNTKQRASWLQKNLEFHKFTVSMIHSGMSTQERKQIMKEFRDGKSRVLISTDLLSRGIDVQQLSVVINYDIPNDKECYIHRIGRSGRFGKKGIAINFVTFDDFWKLEELMRHYQTHIDPMPKNIEKYLQN